MQESSEVKPLAPLDYVSLSPHEFYNIGIAWPWKNVNVSEFFDMTSKLIKTDQYQLDAQAAGVAFSVPGSISCCLAMCTLWSRAFLKKNPFFLTMFLISLMDALFQFTYLAYSCTYRTTVVYGSASKTVMWLSIVLRSVTYSLSLASNFLTLSLTFERYLAVVHPHFLHGLHYRTRQRLNLLVIAAVMLLSSVKWHNTLTLRVVATTAARSNNVLYVFEASPLESHPAMISLVMFSEIVLPFLLVLSMCLLSLVLIVAVVKHRKLPTMINVASDSTNQNAAAYQMKIRKRKPMSYRLGSMTSLTVVLDVMFILNQTGYSTVASVSLLLKQTSINFDSSSETIALWIYYKRVSYVIAVVSIAFECLSHTLNFPMYVLFSKTMKTELRLFFLTVRRRLTNGQQRLKESCFRVKRKKVGGENVFQLRR